MNHLRARPASGVSHHQSTNVRARRGSALLAHGVAFCAAIAACGGGVAHGTERPSCLADVTHPSHCQLQDYEKEVLFPWLVNRDYRRAARPDKGIRDTGPFIQLKYYGTHPAVRIYYSPEVISWLKNDRAGEIPDGAFIVKEMFRPPAAIYEELRAHRLLADNPGLYQELLDELLTSWVVMIKDRKGDSVDGWFWGGLGAPPHRDCLKEPSEAAGECKTWLDGALDDYSHVFYSGFGLGTCIRCHASAAGESTFSDARNISGIDSDEPPLQFRTDNSWRSPRYLGSYRLPPESDSESPESDSEEIKIEDYLASLGAPAEKCRFEQTDRPENPRDVVLLFDIVKRFLLDHDDPDPCALLNRLSISPHLRPYDDGSEPTRESYGPHSPRRSSKPTLLVVDERPAAAPHRNADFADAFPYPFPNDESTASFTLPKQWADHVYPGRGGPGAVPKSHDQYITSNNCIGCHGGLAGSPYPLSMFVQTGATTEDGPEGFDISPYNEWRWSPMGLAGRDPIFHAQLESELILLREDGAAKLAPNTPAQAQKALINTCLSCHGAMGQRQLGIDADACKDNPAACDLDPDFNPDYYYLTGALTEEELRDWKGSQGLQPPFSNSSPRPDYKYTGTRDFYSYHKYGELAREGISCAVCHHIAAPGSTEEGRAALDAFVSNAPDEWLPQRRGPIWSDNFIYYLAKNTTGRYETGPANEIYGPFNDVLEKPMQASLGITPREAPPMADKLSNVFAWRRATREARAPTSFTADSNMCGTCHMINLPNVGLEPDPDCDPIEDLDCNPILTEVENFPEVENLTKEGKNKAFKEYVHSIEQATYLEWVNSDFGPGMFNARGPDFKSCQDCHMPNRLTSYTRDVLADPKSRLDPNEPVDTSEHQAGDDGDRQVHVAPLVSQIATIQDTTYPASDNTLAPEQLSVPLRDTYRRHELVGLNAFLIEMASQFPGILGVDPTAYETGAKNGAELAIDSILLSAREQRVVSLELGTPAVTLTEKGHTLTTQVTVTNWTGHRFPSGVAFRRAWIEFAVWDASRDELLWASGRANGAGLIIDTKGNVLETELLDQTGGLHGLARYQPHYQKITSDDQVQIYEELITNAEYEFTTSFIHRVHHVKDNRLLPKGWVDASTFAGYNDDLAHDDPRKIQPQGEVLLQFFKAADPLLHYVPKRPKGEDPAKNESGEPAKDEFDPDYRPGKDPATGHLTPVAGADSLQYAILCRDLGGCDEAMRIEVTVHFQATPPSWLNQRFALAREAKKQGFATPATDRLYYLMSHLDLSGSPIKDYKLPLVSSTVRVPSRP